MFNNVGEKIKGFAIAILVIAILAFSLMGLAVISEGGVYVVIGVAIIIGGILIAVLGAMLLFAYGQIATNTDKMVEIGKIQTKILLNQTDIMAEVEDKELAQEIYATDEAKEIVELAVQEKEMSEYDLYMIARREQAEQSMELPEEENEEDDEDDEE